MDDNEEFLRFRKLKKKLVESSSKQYNESSKTRLKAIADKKVQTTMIGALHAIEEEFGVLWGLSEGGKKPNRPLTEEEQHALSIYTLVRDKILDLGNKQRRNLEAEIDLYDIKWNRYNYDFPVKPEGPKGNKNE